MFLHSWRDVFLHGLISKLLSTPFFFSSFLFQPTVTLSTATTGGPSEISDFKCSAAGLPSSGLYLHEQITFHFGYNASLINLIFYRLQDH